LRSNAVLSRKNSALGMVLQIQIEHYAQRRHRDRGVALAVYVVPNRLFSGGIQSST
jgi:hypothetical protein